MNLAIVDISSEALMASLITVNDTKPASCHLAVWDTDPQ